MLQNAYFLAKIGADTAENEQHSLQPNMFDAAENEPRSPGRDGGARGLGDGPRRAQARAAGDTTTERERHLLD